MRDVSRLFRSLILCLVEGCKADRSNSFLTTSILYKTEEVLIEYSFEKTTKTCFPWSIESPVSDITEEEEEEEGKEK